MRANSATEGQPYEQLVETLPIGIAVHSDGRLVYVNREAVTIFGASSADELIGTPMLSLVHPDYRDVVQERIEMVLNGEELPTLEEKYIRLDGEVTEAEVTATAFTYNGRPSVQVMIRDISRRKRVQRQLEELDEQYRTLADICPDAITLTDLDGKILHCNQQAAELLGFGTVDQTLGKNAFDFVAPQETERAHAGATMRIDTGVVRGVEYEVQADDGRTFPAEMSASVILDPNGDPKGYLTIFRDLSTRKAVEREVQTRNRQQAAVSQFGQRALAGESLSSLMDAAVDLLVENLDVEYCKLLELLPDEDGLLLRAGAGWEKGHVGETVIGTGKQSHSGYTLLSTEPVIVEDLATETRFSGSSLLVDHDVVSGMSAVISGRDKPFGVLGVHTSRHRTFTEDDVHFLQAIANILADAIDRKNAEAALAGALNRERVARKQVSFLAEASQILAASFDYRETLNDVAELAVPTISDWCAVDLFDDKDKTLERVAVVHTDPSKVKLAYELHERYPPDLDATRGIAQVLRTGESELYPEIDDALLKASARDQEHLNIMRELGLQSAMVVPLVARKRVLGTITLIAAESERQFGEDDLTFAEELAQRAALAVDNARLYDEAKTLNEELETRVAERTAQLEAANKELESFSYSVSHDLRAPLRAVDGFSRVLLKQYADDFPEPAQSYLERIRVNTEYMDSLIDDLLTFSRLNRQPLEKEVVEPATLVENVLQLLRVEQERRDVKIRIGDLPPCEADVSMLRQVWANLLSNAFKYTQQRDKALIEVGSTEENGTTVYYVRDNGVGFDMRYAEKAFGVFQRLHSAEDYEGTGVGLALVERMIQRHGGRIWVEAEPDHGATFYFTLDHGDSAA